MTNLTKIPHEVSIWDDVLVAVDENGNELCNGALSFFIDIDFYEEINEVLEILATNGYFHFE